MRRQHPLGITPNNAVSSNDINFNISHFENSLDKLDECDCEQLKLREAQFYDILDNMNETVERDSPDYTLNYVNNAFCEFYGVKRADAIGQNTMNFILEDDRAAVDTAMAKLTPENPKYRIEFRVKKADGVIAWIESSGRAFFNNEGKLIEFQDVSREITHFKEAQQRADDANDLLEEKVRQRTDELNRINHELTGLNSYLQNILRNISEGVVTVSELGEIEFLNYGSSDIWKTRENAIKDKLHRDALDKQQNLYKMLNNNSNFKDQEIIIHSSSGDIHCLASGACLELNESNVKRGVLILRPISEVRHLVNNFSGAQARFTFHDITTNSQTMTELTKLAQKAAHGEGNVLIEGESGTGKEIFAQAIHNGSHRSSGPFVAVNCGAIPRELIGSELFGYMEGAFTGAKKGGKPGKFELASGGTIFLDEIGDMPIEQQISLLRVIQERAVTRIGGDKLIAVDVRIICATNKNLLLEVTNGNFRQDLYYRLNVISLKIPPLRERREDILLLFNNFLQKFDKNNYHSFNTVEPDVLEALIKHDWPGNVRELQNVTERILYFADKSQIVSGYLPETILAGKNLYKPKPSAAFLDIQENQNLIEFRKQLKNEKDAQERALILEMLEKFNGNASQVAREMGISRTILYRKMKRISKK